ncbi:MFS transporter [Novosphingopyxis sp.]|uniref:MFS transporter n=1 Tax=Novosphingopyxis sp. TaxID=2709690 RepID=UPI003B593DC3
MASIAPLSTNPADKATPRYAWYVVSALLVVSILGYLDRLILSFLIEPIKAELGLTDTQIGLVTGLAFALLYVVAGIPIGRLMDTRNRVWVLSFCVLIWSVATAASGLAGGFISLFLARVFVGAGEAAVSPAAVSLIGDYFPPNKVQRPLGIFTVGLYAGGGLALILGGQLIAFLTGLDGTRIPGLGVFSAWRTTYFILALPGIFIVALLLLSVRDPRRRHLAASKKAEHTDAFAFFKAHRRLFCLVLASVIMWGFNGYGLLNWYPAMLMRSYGMTTQEVAWSFGPAFLLGGVLGAMSLSFWTRLLLSRGRNDAVFLVATASMALMTLSSTAGPLMPTATGVIVLSFVNLYGSSLTVASAYAIIATVTPGTLRGLYTGVYMSVMNITGGAFGAVIVGVLADYVVGTERLNLALVIVALAFGPVSSLLMFLAARAYRRAPPTV